MNASPLVRDLFDLPDHVGKSAFVVKLTDTVQHPAEAAQTFVVTERLAQSAERVPVSKFQPCLPEPLLVDLLSEKLLDLRGGRSVLKES